MADYKKQNKELQIFYTFVANYETLMATVKEMALMGEPSDYMKAEGICDVIGRLVYDAKSVEVIIDKLEKAGYDQRLAPLMQNLIQLLSMQKDTLIHQLQARYQMLIDILLLRDTIRPSESKVDEGSAMTKEEILQVFEENPIIKKDPGLAIDSGDLKVLNDIASANVTKGLLLSEFSKRFKTPMTRDIIKRLYHEAPYYFEQSFSNTDVNIQGILLEIITEDRKRDAKDEVKKAALTALEDLHILSTIDTSANKMTSKVSDHQAFELFINALSKNDNDFIIRKLVNDDIIMDTMFGISTKDKESYYGFRRLFVTAKYPYDELIIEKYKKVKKLSDKMFLAIVKELYRDETFKFAYEKYLKTEKTKAFMKVIENDRFHLMKASITEELCYSYCFILDEFKKLETYNTDLLTMDFIMEMVSDLYYFIIQNNAYGQYPLLTKALAEFYAFRVNNALSSTRLDYQDFGGEKTFGITPEDMWYDIHCMIHIYGFSHVHKVYLRYENEVVYTFDVGDRCHLFNKTLTTGSTKGLTGIFSFTCYDNDGKGFDLYVFNKLGNMLKTFMNSQIQTKIYSVKTSTFRKTESPGLSISDDKRLRKAIMDYMTLSYLWQKDKVLFLHIYRMRVGGILKALNAMDMTINEMKPYVKLSSNAWILDLFNYQGLVIRMTQEFNRLTSGAKDQLFINHGNNFFELAQEHINP